jgi:predicted transcriptional regulator
MAMNLDAMLRIKADVQGENNIRRLGNSMQGLQGQAKNAALGFNSLKGAVAGFGAAIAGSAIVGGLTAVIKKSIDAGDELFNLQAKTGIAANALIGLGNAAKLADVDQATLGKGLTKLSVNLVKAAEGNDGLAQKFKALGVSIKDANGQVVPADKALKQIADRFADMPDGAQKAAAAVALFGKSGADLIPLLNEGAAAMEKFTYKVGEDFAARSDLFNDTITEFGIKTQGFGLELTDALLPALQSILEVFGDLFDTKQDWSALFDVIIVGLRAVATVIYATIKLVDVAIKNLVAYFDAVGKVLQGDFGGAADVVKNRIGGLLEQARQDFAQIQKIWTGAPSPGTGRRTGGRNMALDTGDADQDAAASSRNAAAEARRAASEQERLLERRASLTQQAISLQEELRNSVADVTAAYEGVGATRTEQLFLDRNEAITENDRLIKKLTLDVVTLAREVNAAGGSLDIKPFEDLINQLSRLNVDVADKTYQGGLKDLTQQQADAMTALRRESGLLTQDEERQLDINEKLAQIQREMPELYAAQKDEITALVTASAGLTEAQERNKQLVMGIADTIGGSITSAFDLLLEGTDNWGNSLREIASGVLKDIARQLLQIMVIQPIVKGITKGFGFANGGIMTGDGPMPLKTYARGGIANSPQLAMFGEGSMPEAYVPLPDGRRIPVAMQGGSGGGTSVVVNVDAKGTSVQGSNGQGEQLGRVIAQAVQQELIRQKRPGGLLVAA